MFAVASAPCRNLSAHIGASTATTAALAFFSAICFAVLPNVQQEEPYWGMKSRARESLQLSSEPHYEPIEMPRNSPTGFITAFFATVTGFALIWHIWWMVIAGALGAFATFVVFAWRDEDEYVVPAEDVARIDRAYRSVRQPEPGTVGVG